MAWRMLDVKENKCIQNSIWKEISNRTVVFSIHTFKSSGHPLLFPVSNICAPIDYHMGAYNNARMNFTDYQICTLQTEVNGWTFKDYHMALIYLPFPFIPLPQGRYFTIIHACLTKQLIFTGRTLCDISSISLHKEEKNSTVCFWKSWLYIKHRDGTWWFVVIENPLQPFKVSM